MQIRTERVSQWLDAGTPKSVLETNAHLLQNRQIIPNEVVTGSSNVLIQPVYIHESSHVENSIIGPYVSIGENCSIHGSILKNTIIDDDSTINDVTLINSLIGKGCSVSSQPVETLVSDNDEARFYTPAGEKEKAR